MPIYTRRTALSGWCGTRDDGDGDDTKKEKKKKKKKRKKEKESDGVSLINVSD